MKKLSFLLVLLVLVLSGCTSFKSEVQEDLNKEKAPEPTSEYTNKSLEFTASYVPVENAIVAEGNVMYDVTVAIENPKLNNVDAHVFNMEFEDYEGNIYQVHPATPVTEIRTVESLTKVETHIYVEMPIGSEIKTIFFYDEKGELLESITFDYK